MKSLRYLPTFFSFICMFSGSAALAQTGQAPEGCGAYPYSVGTNIEDVNGGTKIISTASASVSFDDIDSIKDAREEAELEAKAAIAKFLSEGIRSDSTIDKAINETKTMSGEQKEVLRKEASVRIKRLSSSSQALLRGVVVLGDCYTKAREYRVSVGLKPETIAAAGNIASGMGSSLSSQPTPTMSNQPPAGGTNQSSTGAQGAAQPGGAGSSTRPLQGSDSFSNSQRLQKF
jgi:hypothetical protein